MLKPLFSKLAFHRPSIIINVCFKLQYSSFATMKAIVVSKFGGPDELRLDVNVPKPSSVGPQQVLIKLEAATVNPVDTYIRQGQYAALPKLPYTPGRDGAGIVEAVASNVKNVSVGQRVYTMNTETGTYAQMVLANANMTFPLSDKLSFKEGAAIGIAYFTAYIALMHRAECKKNETVLIHGASGGVGTAAIQIAKAHGLKVFATAGSDKGLQLVRDCGADFVYNHKDPERIKSIMNDTNGEGVDIVLEMLANENLPTDLEVVAKNGRIIIIGSRGSVEINPRMTMLKQSKIIGMLLGGNHTTEEQFEQTSKALFKGMEDGWLKPILGKEYPLSEAAQAHRDIINPPNGASGKIILNTS